SSSSPGSKKSSTCRSFPAPAVRCCQDRIPHWTVPRRSGRCPKAQGQCSPDRKQAIKPRPVLPSPLAGEGPGMRGRTSIDANFVPAARLKENHLMKMSFWSQCQGLICRLQCRRRTRPRERHRPWYLAETLEARALLSSTPAMVADINPGSASANPGNLVAIGATIYFTASDSTHGQELWKSDSTA